MKRYLLHTPFSIYHFEANVWIHPVHRHTYFEIIFILSGNGIHNINGNTFRYSEGDIFLLGPEDYHHFEIDETTEFCFVRFNDSIYKNSTDEKDILWQQAINTLLHTSSQSRGTIVHDKHEKKKLHSLLTILEEENENNQSRYFDSIRTSLMRSIMIILARNLFDQTASSPMLKDSAEAILGYIKQHIYEPAQLTIEHLADVFNYAPDYISIFFKRHTGESIKQFERIYQFLVILKGGKEQPILKDGVSISILEEYRKKYFFPSELEELYFKYNGIIDPVEGDRVIDFYISPLDGYFLSIEECEKHLKIIMDIEELGLSQFGESLLFDITNRNFFPLIYDGNSRYLIVCTDGSILYYGFDSVEPELPLVYKNICDFYITLETCFKRNIFYLDQTNVIEFKAEDLFALISELNPEISYWHN